MSLTIKKLCFKGVSLRILKMDNNHSIFFDTHLNEFVFFIQENKKIYSRFFVLVDENTEKYCLPLFNKYIENIALAPVAIKIPVGEKNKTIDTCQTIWSVLTAHYADRKALLLNLGGGLVCDMGAFAASTYKRGISYVNIPTTLLAMADASVGGKAAVNFKGHKNHIGLFSNPAAVFISETFLNTLPPQELKSGFAELIKHALIGGSEYWEKFRAIDLKNLSELIYDSVQIKKNVVAQDPLEKGYRKVLNLGHTIGHALETLSHDKNSNPLLHGEAVAIGLFCAAHISFLNEKLPQQQRDAIAELIVTHYKYFPLPQSMYDTIFDEIRHDKKNYDRQIKMVLLHDVGDIIYDCQVSKEDIFAALDYYNSLYNKRHG